MFHKSLTNWWIVVTGEGRSKRWAGEDKRPQCSQETSTQAPQSERWNPILTLNNRNGLMNKWNWYLQYKILVTTVLQSGGCADLKEIEKAYIVFYVSEGPWCWRRDLPGAWCQQIKAWIVAILFPWQIKIDSWKLSQHSTGPFCMADLFCTHFYHVRIFSSKEIVPGAKEIWL